MQTVIKIFMWGKPSIVDESNRNGTKQEMFSEQESFVQTEIIFTLRKNGGYRTSCLGGRLHPVVRQADLVLPYLMILLI